MVLISVLQFVLESFYVVEGSNIKKCTCDFAY